ncbi:MAG: YolD-like family protein [Ruminococcus sp.]|nr:YolD-like family protein [Ruminococcus sp.]
MASTELQRHADRALQFAPFAALKGYYECVREQERIIQPRKELGEEDAEIISNILNNLNVGTIVKIRYYDVDAYTNIEGAVTEINYPYRRLKVIKSTVPFDDIYSIEPLGKGIV